jgi:AcrR family transcriptional regulator
MEPLKNSKPEPGAGALEAAVLHFACKHPQFGQARVAHELSMTGHSISPSGVRYIWKKHDLETAYKRLKALETSPAKASQKLTGSQLAIVKRGDISRRLAQKTRGNRTTGEAAPDERQNQILGAAAELFVVHGYGGTSIRDIAQRVGLLPGSVYHHFPSKEDLFVAIHREGFRRLVVRSENAIKAESDPWRRLELACSVHIDAVVAGDAIARITAIGLFAIHEDRLQKRLEKDRRNYDQKLRKLVLDLDLPATTDRSIFRLALLGTLNWSLIWFRPGKSSPNRIAREIVKIFRGNV